MRGLLKMIMGCGAAGCLFGALPRQLAAQDQRQIDSVRTLDPEVRTGVLPNGLRYYVRANAKPENRAEFHLVLNAGSLQEDEDQLGLAHFVEHMAFNGTKHFPKQQLIDFLEGTGMSFGAHLNAFTSFTTTAYQLAVPTDKPKNIDVSLQILEDWAQHISFDPKEVDLERGVVVAEWRQRLGAGARIMDSQLPYLYQGSKYVDRLPIGKPEIIQNASYEIIRRFYRDWYRPDLMAIVVVGTIDPIAIEAKIRERFSALRNPPSPRPKITERLPINEKPLASVITDSEATGRSITIGFKDTMVVGHTRATERMRLIRGLTDQMINLRISEITQRPDAPFFGASVSGSALTDFEEMRTISVSLKNDQYVDAIEAALREVERAAQHGFLPSELGRQKSSYIRSLEQAYLERENIPSGSLAQAYISNFLTKTPARSIGDEIVRARELLNSITLADVNQAARYGFPKRGRMVSVVVPAGKPGEQRPPSGERIFALVDAIDQQKLDPYVDAASNAPFLSSLPTPGTIVRDTQYTELGITQWTLSNGARVLLKPTAFRNDDVMIVAHSMGGLYMLADSDVATGQMINSIVGASGYGNLTRDQLQKRMAGKILSLRKQVDNASEGIAGRASPKDLESFFQSLYAMWTQPRYDSVTIAALLDNVRISIENAASDPMKAFTDTMHVTIVQNSSRHPIMSLDLLRQVEPKRAMQLYQERFASATDFTFVIVGAFTPENIKPLVLQYLASLPAGGREELPDRGIRSPAGIVKKVMYGGREPKSHSIVTYHGNCANDPGVDQRLKVQQLSFLGEILKHRLRIRLREELSGTYGVAVQASMGFKPQCRFTISTEFITAPERREELTEAFFAVVDELRTNGPTTEEVERVRTTMLRGDETGMKSNEFWMEQIMQFIQVGWPLEQLLDRSALNRITPAMIRDVAGKFFPGDNYMHFVLDPEMAKTK